MARTDSTSTKGAVRSGVAPPERWSRRLQRMEPLPTTTDELELEDEEEEEEEEEEAACVIAERCPSERSLDRTAFPVAVSESWCSTWTQTSCRAKRPVDWWDDCWAERRAS